MTRFLTWIGWLKSDFESILAGFETTLANLDAHIVSKALEAEDWAQAEAEAVAAKIAASSEAKKAAQIVANLRTLLTK